MLSFILILKPSICLCEYTCLRSELLRSDFLISNDVITYVLLVLCVVHAIQN